MLLYFYMTEPEGCHSKYTNYLSLSQHSHNKDERNQNNKDTHNVKTAHLDKVTYSGHKQNNHIRQMMFSGHLCD